MIPIEGINTGLLLSGCKGAYLGLIVGGLLETIRPEF